MPNHVHMLIDLSPTYTLSDVVGDIKSHSSQWMRKSGLFPIFEGWARGYYASGVSVKDKENVINYITGQQELHKSYPFDEEMKWLYKRNCLEWHDNDLL